MQADDASLEQFYGLQRLDPGSGPVAGVSAGANPFIAIPDDGQHIVRVPNFVVRIVSALRMFVDSSTDIEFLDQLFDDIEMLDTLGRNSVKPHLFGELKYQEPFRFI